MCNIKEKNEKKVNILMIGSSPKVKGGISSVIKQMLGYQWPQNINIYFISTHIEASTCRKGIYFLKSVFKIINQYCFKKIDIVHIHLSYNGSFFRKYIIFLLSKIFNVKIIIHLHGSEFQQFYDKSNSFIKGLIRTLFKGSNCTIVLGEEWNNRVKKIEPTTKTVILKNAIKIPKIKAQSNQKEFTILYLGTLIERKGIFDLLTAIKSLGKNLDYYKVRLVIGGSGPEEEKIKNYIKKYNLYEYVNLVGWVNYEKKKLLLERSQLLILPSYNEGLPISILEGISYGLPIIATNVGSVSEAVINNYNGFLINPGMPREIEISIRTIITDKELWEKMSFNSKKLALDKFDEKNFFNKLINIYDSLG